MNLKSKIKEHLFFHHSQSKSSTGRPNDPHLSAMLERYSIGSVDEELYDTACCHPMEESPIPMNSASTSMYYPCSHPTDASFSSHFSSSCHISEQKKPSAS